MIASRTRCPVRSGFTLVELLVVIAAVGILVALLLPTVSRARAAARQTACASALRILGQGLTAYATDHGVFPVVSNSISGRYNGNDGVWIRTTYWYHFLSPYVGPEVSADVPTQSSRPRLRPSDLVPGRHALRGCPEAPSNHLPPYGYNPYVPPGKNASAFDGPGVTSVMPTAYPRPSAVPRASERALIADSVGYRLVTGLWPWWEQEQLPMPRRPDPAVFSPDYNRHPARPGRRVGADDLSLNMLFADLSVRTVSAREAHYAATFQSYYPDRPGWRSGR